MFTFPFTTTPRSKWFSAHAETMRACHTAISVAFKPSVPLQTSTAPLSAAPHFLETLDKHRMVFIHRLEFNPAKDYMLFQWLDAQGTLQDTAYLLFTPSCSQKALQELAAYLLKPPEFGLQNRRIVATLNEEGTLCMLGAPGDDEFNALFASTQASSEIIAPASAMDSDPHAAAFPLGDTAIRFSEPPATAQGVVTAQEGSSDSVSDTNPETSAIPSEVVNRLVMVVQEAHRDKRSRQATQACYNNQYDWARSLSLFDAFSVAVTSARDGSVEMTVRGFSLKTKPSPPDVDQLVIYHLVDTDGSPMPSELTLSYYDPELNVYLSVLDVVTLSHPYAKALVELLDHHSSKDFELRVDQDYHVISLSRTVGIGRGF